MEELFIYPNVRIHTQTHFHSLKQALPPTPPPRVTRSLFWALADEKRRGTGALMRASEWKDSSRARNTALSRLPVKEGIISHGLGVLMACSRHVSQSKLLCLTLSRQGGRGSRQWGGTHRPAFLKPKKCIRTHRLPSRHWRNDRLWQQSILTLCCLNGTLSVSTEMHRFSYLAEEVQKSFNVPLKPKKESVNYNYYFWSWLDSSNISQQWPTCTIQRVTSRTALHMYAYH